MKIVCGNCEAKYSIADEKVQGKVFKIRCKKCGEVIVVRGTDQQVQQHAEIPVAQPAGLSRPASDDFESRGFGQPAFTGGPEEAEIWHVVIEGEQRGPMTQRQLGEFIQGGHVDAESYVWRDGFDDWMALRDVSELASLFAPASEAAASQAGFGEPGEPQGDLFSGGGGFDAPPEPESPFSAAKDSESGGLFGSGGGLFDAPAASSPAEIFSSTPAAFGETPSPAGGGFQAEQDDVLSSTPVASRAKGHDMGADLFAASAHAAEEPKGRLFGGAPEEQLPDPRYDAGSPALTGARNENSVLFSLSNLQALASSKAAVKDSAKTAGHAAGDASGLIDIRTMAATISIEKTDRPAVDDFLSLGGAAAFGGALGAPILAPARTGLSKGLLIGLISGGVVLAGLVTVLIVILLFPKETPEKTQMAKATPSATLAEAASRQLQNLNTPPGTAGTGQQQPNPASAQAGAPGTPPPATAGENKPETGSGGEKGESKRGGHKRGKGSHGESGESDKEDTEKSAGSGGGDSLIPGNNSEKGSGKSSGGGDELDQLLNTGVKNKLPPAQKREVAPSAPNPSPGGGESDTLSRSQVQSGMNAIKPAIEKCGRGTPGTAMVNITIAGATGAVTNAVVTGQFAGKPEGSCISGVVRRARFPKFGRDKLTITYPFRIP